ncbi:ankyrin repeat domain-containing protein [Hyalangium versicolor]|uniref:ankyrin repeat domain-containing protein n=1 Tax=Hyalangium versicolor TaxID=2861190 RepID=UPI001CCD2D7A|nr:ankyrin repeat domain-containing protein [Hyalangium versicolor]
MPEPAKWLAADDPGNPFGVPLLNLMLTQEYVATTQDPANAQRAVSWMQSVGDELDVRKAMAAPAIDCALTFPAAAILPDGIVYAPPSMDQKWVLAWRHGQLIAARSWTGEVEAVAEARHEGASLRVERLHLVESSMLRLGEPSQTFEWLIRCHALGEKLPFPVDEQGASVLQDMPLQAFSGFGKVIFCAARTWAPPAATRPLRSDGRLIRAAQRGDLAALSSAVEAGESVDAQGTHDGYTALHWAVARGDRAMLERLLSLGAKATSIDDRGGTSLMIAVVYRAPLEVLEVVRAAAPALAAAANSDGFTALHAAAEVNNAQAVPWLLSSGLPLEVRTKHGHTALHIACALGHVEAARALLDAGADRNASSPGGTPREVALAEGKPQTAALFE